MTSSFQLTLDTAAPQIVWGAVDGANVTETLTVQYIVDEPGVLSAELELADSRRIAMAVAPGQLSVVVPGDAPEGWGTVIAVLRDDVWNTATAELPVYISGVLTPAPAAPPSAPPQGPDIHPIRVETPPSIAMTSDDFTVGAVVSTTSRLRVRSRYVAPTRKVAFRIRDRLAVASTYTLLARTESSGGVVTGTAEDVVIRRGEGPDAMDELLALGLL